MRGKRQGSGTTPQDFWSGKGDALRKKVARGAIDELDEQVLPSRRARYGILSQVRMRSFTSAPRCRI